MNKPVEPNKEDCCNSGCHPCIFDIYEKQLNLYKKYLENGGNLNHTPEENGIAQLEYTKFTVVKSVHLCDFHNIIKFKRLPLDGKKVWWKPGDHFLYKYSSDGVSCTRAYTPITIKNELSNDYDFAIIVKRYENGLVSSQLYNLNEDCVTLWRGPYGSYEITPNTFDRIIMIAQGTGILPFVNIIDSVLDNEDDMTKIILIYCCRNINTILFRDELHDYKSYWNFNYEIYLSSSLEEAKLKYEEPINDKKFCLEDLHDLTPFNSKDQFLICGSPQFNEYYNIHIKKIHTEVANIVLF